MKPVIVIPMGDPNGIGPEIILKALLTGEAFKDASPLVTGNADILDLHNRQMGIGANIRCVSGPEQADWRAGVVNIIHVETPGTEKLKIGTVQAKAGQCAFDYIKAACRLAIDGKAAAVATTPINKESLRAAGVNYIGHTEIFASLTGIDDPLTMFEVRNLRVFFLSRHVSLSESISLVTKQRVMDYIKRCWTALHCLGIRDGTMAVAGLNPHCGEHGLFGYQEVNELEPAVRQAQAEGYSVTGPVGADSVFAQALAGRYNSVLSLYHDQGHIATKTLDFERTIALTVGMPFLRTSVDHGTALDIAGKNIASEVSMLEAICLAAKYAAAYNASAALPRTNGLYANAEDTIRS